MVVVQVATHVEVVSVVVVVVVDGDELTAGGVVVVVVAAGGGEVSSPAWAAGTATNKAVVAAMVHKMRFTEVPPVSDSGCRLGSNRVRHVTRRHERWCDFPSQTWMRSTAFSPTAVSSVRPIPFHRTGELPDISLETAQFFICPREGTVPARSRACFLGEQPAPELRRPAPYAGDGSFKQIPAATYSPRQLPTKYHRRYQA